LRPTRLDCRSRLAQLGLGALALGDVASGCVDNALLRQGPGSPLHPEVSTVDTDVAVLEPCDGLAASSPFEHVARHRHLVGVTELQDGTRQEFFTRIPETFF